MADKVDILVDLIKMNEENTNKKMDMLSARLCEHIDDNKNDFNELKSIMQTVSTDIQSSHEKLYRDTLTPLTEKIEKHSIEIDELKRESCKYIKEDICKQNEKVINDKFWAYTKKLIMFNAVFIILYLVLLYNSNITIDWNGFVGMLSAVKKIF